MIRVFFNIRLGFIAVAQMAARCHLQILMKSQSHATGTKYSKHKSSSSVRQVAVDPNLVYVYLHNASNSSSESPVISAMSATA